MSLWRPASWSAAWSAARPALTPALTPALAPALTLAPPSVRRQLIKLLLELGGALSYAKELRDLFVDILEVVDLLKLVGAPRRASAGVTSHLGSPLTWGHLSPGVTSHLESRAMRNHAEARRRLLSALRPPRGNAAATL